MVLKTNITHKHRRVSDHAFMLFSSINTNTFTPLSKNGKENKLFSNYSHHRMSQLMPGTRGGKDPHADARGSANS